MPESVLDTLRNDYQKEQAASQEGPGPKPKGLPVYRPLGYASDKAQFVFGERPLQMEAMNEYDKGFIPDTGMNQEWNRASNQSTLDLTGKALKRFVVSAPLKFAQSVSDIGGLMTGHTPMDNPLSEGLREMEDAWKEMNPVYRSQDYDTGTVWDKMTSGSFLANDFIDGAAFMASAWGGTKLIGSGVSGAIRAITPELELAATVAKDGRTLEGGSKVVNFLLKNKLDANKLTRITTSGLNTISESLAEGIDSYKQVKEDLLRKKQLGMSGHPEYAKYAQLGDDQIESESRLAYQETFNGNLAILALPNWLESGWWLGKKGKAGFSEQLSKAFVAGKLEEEAEKVGLKHGVLAFAKGFGSEGLWEENMQSALQAYEKTISDPTLNKNQRGLLPAMTATFSNAATNLKGFSKSLLGGNIDANSEEGQGAISIWLGGALGSPMAVAGHYKEVADNKTERTELQKWLDSANLSSRLYNQGFDKTLRFALEPDAFEKEKDGTISRDKNGQPRMKFNTDKKVRDIQQQYFREMTAHHAMMADMTDNEIYGALNTMHSAFDLALELEQSRWDKDIKDEMVRKAVKSFNAMSEGTPAVPESKDKDGNIIPAQEAVVGTNVGKGLFTEALVNSYRDIYRNTYQANYNKVFRSFDTGDVNKKRFLLDMIHNQTIETFRLATLNTLLNGKGGIAGTETEMGYVKSKSGQEQLRAMIEEKEESIKRFDLRQSKSTIEAMYEEYKAAQSIDTVRDEYLKVKKDIQKLVDEKNTQTEQEVEQTTKDKDGKDIVTKVKQKMALPEEKRKELEARIKEKQAEAFLKRQKYEEQAGVHGKTVSDNFFYDEQLAADALAGKNIDGTENFQAKTKGGSRTRLGGRFSEYWNTHLEGERRGLISSVSANIVVNRVKMAGDLTLIDQLEDLMQDYTEQVSQGDELAVAAIIEQMLVLLTQNKDILYQASLFNDSIVSKFLDMIEGVKGVADAKNTFVKEAQERGEEIEKILSDPQSDLNKESQRIVDTLNATNQLRIKDGLAPVRSFKELEATDYDEEGDADLYEIKKDQLKYKAKVAKLTSEYKKLDDKIGLEKEILQKYINLLSNQEASQTGPERMGLYEASARYDIAKDKRAKSMLEHRKTAKGDYDKASQLDIESEWNIVPTEAYFRSQLIEQMVDEPYYNAELILSSLEKFFVNTPAKPFNINDESTWEVKPDVSFPVQLVLARELKAQLEEVLNAANSKTEDKSLITIAKAYKDYSRTMSVLGEDGTISIERVLALLDVVIQNEDNRQAINIARMKAFEEGQKKNNEAVVNTLLGTTDTKLDDSYGLIRTLQSIKEKKVATSKVQAEERLKAKKEASLSEIKAKLASQGIELPHGFDEMSTATRLNALLFSLPMLSYLSGVKGVPHAQLMRDAFKEHAFIRTLQSTGDINQALAEIEKDAFLLKPENKVKQETLIALINSMMAVLPIELAEAYLYSTIGDEGNLDKYTQMLNILSTIDEAPKTGLGYAPNYLQINAFIESVIYFDISEKEEKAYMDKARKEKHVDKDDKGVERYTSFEVYQKTKYKAPLSANLLLGVSGSGKTIGTQLLVKYYLALNPTSAKKVLLVGHTAASAQNLKNEALRTIDGAQDMVSVTNVEYYNMLPEQRAQFDLVIADEQFTLSQSEFLVFSQSGRNVLDMNHLGEKSKVDPATGKNGLFFVKTPVLFIMGDSSQPRGELRNYMTNLETVEGFQIASPYFKVRRLTPLSIGYRASVQAIESVAYQFKSSLSPVYIDSSEANKSIDEFRAQDDIALIERNKTIDTASRESLDIIGLISENDADEKLRQAKILELAQMLDKRSVANVPTTVIIVANDAKKEAYNKALGIMQGLKPKHEERIFVMTFNDVQGRTFENVLIDYVESDEIIQREVMWDEGIKGYKEANIKKKLADLGGFISTDYKKNSNIYMAITRGKKFVYVNGISNAKLNKDSKLQQHVFAKTKEAEALRDNFNEVKKNWGLEKTAPVVATPPVVTTSTPPAAPPTPPDATTPIAPIVPVPPAPPATLVPDPPVSVTPIDNKTPIVDNEIINDETEFSDDTLIQIGTDELVEGDTLEAFLDTIQTDALEAVLGASEFEEQIEAGSKEFSIQHPAKIGDLEYITQDKTTTFLVQPRYKILEEREQVSNGKRFVYPAGLDSQQAPNSGPPIPNAIAVPTFSTKVVNGKEVSFVETRIFIPLVTKYEDGEVPINMYVNAGTLRHVTQGEFKSETDTIGSEAALNNILNGMTKELMEEYAAGSNLWNTHFVTQLEIDTHRAKLERLAGSAVVETIMPEMVVLEQADLTIRNFKPTETDDLLSASETVVKMLRDLANKDSNNVNDDTLINFIKSITTPEGKLRTDIDFFTNGRKMAQAGKPALLFEMATEASVSKESKRGANFLAQSSLALKRAFGERGVKNGIYGMPQLQLVNIPIGMKDGVSVTRDFFIPLSSPKLSANSALVQTYQALTENLTGLKTALLPVLAKPTATRPQGSELAELLLLDAVRYSEEKNRLASNGLDVPIEEMDTASNLLNTPFLSVLLYAGQELFKPYELDFVRKTIGDNKSALTSYINESLAQAEENIIMGVYKNWAASKKIEDRSVNYDKSKEIGKIKRQLEDNDNSSLNVLRKQINALLESIGASSDSELNELKEAMTQLVYGNDGAFFGKSMKNALYTYEDVLNKVNDENKKKGAPLMSRIDMAQSLLSQLILNPKVGEISFDTGDAESFDEAKNNAVTYTLSDTRIPRNIYVFLEPLKNALNKKLIGSDKEKAAQLATLILKEEFETVNGTLLRKDGGEIKTYEDFLMKLLDFDYKRTSFDTATKSKTVEKQAKFDLKAAKVNYAHEQFIVANSRFKDKHGVTKQLVIGKADKNMTDVAKQRATGRKARFNVYARLTDTDFNFPTKQRLLREKLLRDVTNQDKSQFPTGLFEAIKTQAFASGKVKKRDTYGVNDTIFRSWLAEVINGDSKTGWNASDDLVPNPINEQNAHALYLAIWRTFQDNEIGLIEFIDTMAKMGDMSYSESIQENGKDLPIPMTESDIQSVIANPEKHNQSVSFGRIRGLEKRTEVEKALQTNMSAQLNTEVVHKDLEDAEPKSADMVLANINQAFPAVPFSIKPNKLKIQKAKTASEKVMSESEKVAKNEEIRASEIAKAQEENVQLVNQANDTDSLLTKDDLSDMITPISVEDSLSALTKRLEAAGVPLSKRAQIVTALTKSFGSEDAIKTTTNFYGSNGIKALAELTMLLLEGRSFEEAYAASKIGDITPQEDGVINEGVVKTDLALILSLLVALPEGTIKAPAVGRGPNKQPPIAFKQQTTSEKIKSIRKRVEGDVLTYAQSVLADLGLDEGTVKMVSRLTDAVIVEAESSKKGKPVWGYVKKGAIRLENSATKTDFNHEFFHYTFRYLMTPEERALMIKNAAKTYGKSFTDMHVLEQEEFLAERFESYMQFRRFDIENGNKAKGLLGQMKGFLWKQFNRLAELFNWLIGRRAQADFDAIRKGQYRIYNNMWDQITSGEAYEIAFSNGANLEKIEEEPNLKGATVHGLIREIFSKLPDTNEGDYIDYVATIENTIGNLYMNGEKAANKETRTTSITNERSQQIESTEDVDVYYAMTYHQAIGQAFNALMARSKKEDTTLPIVFTKLRNRFKTVSEDEARKQQYTIFASVIDALIQDITDYVDVDKDDTVEMGERIINKENEKKKAEDNPTTHLRHALKTFTRTAQDGSVYTVSKEKIFLDTIDIVRFSDMKEMDTLLEQWAKETTLASRLLDNDDTRSRPLVQAGENNGAAIKRRIIQMRRDMRILNSNVTDDPAKGKRTVPIEAGNMEYVYDKYKHGYGLKYTNGKFSNTYYIDGRLNGHKNSYSPEQLHLLMQKDLADWLNSPEGASVPIVERQKMINALSERRVYNLLVRRAEASEQMKSISQTLGSLTRMKLVSDTEGHVKGKLKMARKENSVSVSYEDVRATLSDSLIVGVENLLGVFSVNTTRADGTIENKIVVGEGKYDAYANPIKLAMKKEALLVKGFTAKEANSEIENTGNQKHLSEIDTLIDDVFNFLASPSNRVLKDRFLNRNNPNALADTEEEGSVNVMEELMNTIYSSSPEREVKVPFANRLLESTKFINSLDTETIRLTMKSANGDLLYSFQNGTFMMSVWREMKNHNSNLDKLRAQFPFLKSKNFKYNAFNSDETNGKNRIFDYFTYDAYKQTYTESIKVFKAENEQEFLRRVINYHFLHNMASASMTTDGNVSKLRYDQETFPLEGRSRLQMASINFLNKEELAGSINLIISQLREREHALIQKYLKSPEIIKSDGSFTDHVFNYLGVSESLMLEQGVSREQIVAFKESLSSVFKKSEDNIWAVSDEVLAKKMNAALMPIMDQIGKSIWKSMVNYQKTIHPDLLMAARNMASEGWLTEDELSSLVSIMAPNATEGIYPSLEKFFTDKTTGERTYFYDRLTEADKETVDTLMGKLIGAYQYNRYVNSYHLNQMIAGDLIMYKKDLDLIKRLLGTSTPGQNLMIDNVTEREEGESEASWLSRLTATSPYTNAIIVSDPVLEIKGDNKVDEFGLPVPEMRRSMESSIRRILQPEAEIAGLVQTETAKLASDKEIEKAVNQILAAHGKDGFDMTDGYCLMTVAGYENLKRGLSRAYDLGDAQKLIYYGVDEHVAQLRDAEIASPYYVKSSYLVLTEALIAQYPALKRLNLYLEKANAQELHFGSSIKVGATVGNDKYSDITVSDDNAATLGQAGLENSRIVRMNNKYRKAIYNPVSKLDSNIALFSQMIYMQMVNTPSGDNANTIVNALAFLFEKGIKKEIDKMEGNFGAFIQETIKNSPVLANYDEHLSGTLSDEDIDMLMTDATIRKAVMTAVTSTITKRAINIRFKGAKFISGPSELITGVGERPLTMRLEKIYDPISKKTTVQYVHDCIVSKGMLDEEQLALLEKIRTNKNVDGTGFDIDAHRVLFEKGDFLSMRLPTTGKHSGAVMRIVDYHDSPANIIFVSPESSKILGEDYDADARFSATREKWDKEPIQIGYTINGVFDSIRIDAFQPIGYFRKKIMYKKQVKIAGTESYLLSVPTEHEVWSTSYEYVLEQTETVASLKAHINGLLAGLTDRRSPAATAYKKELKALDKFEDVLLKNLIVETVMENLSDPKHIIEMLLPITTEQFNPLIDKLELDMGWHDEMKEKNNPSIIPDTVKLHANIHGGDIITGAGANGYKEDAYIFNTALDETGEKELAALREKIKEKKKENSQTPVDSITSEIERLEDLKAMNAIYRDSNKRSLEHGNKLSTDRRTGVRFLQMPIRIESSIGMIEYGYFTENAYWNKDGEMEFGLSIWEQLDAIINLALDNLKENKLGKLSISNDTFQAILGGLSLGIPFQKEKNLMGTLLYQPAIKMLTHSQYVGISDIHKRIGLDLIKKEEKRGRARAVFYPSEWKEGAVNDIGSTLMELLITIDPVGTAAAFVQDEKNPFYDLNAYLLKTTANESVWTDNAHKGYFKAMETILLDMASASSTYMVSQNMGGATKSKLVNRVNETLSSILKADLKTNAFDSKDLFTNETFAIFLKQQLKALIYFKQLDVLGSDINKMNTPINALRVNPTDQIEIKELLAEKKSFGPTLNNMPFRYTKGMSFTEYQNAISTGEFKIRTAGMSINPENFINKQPHIFSANLGLEQAQNVINRHVLIENPVYRDMIEHTLEMLAEGKFNNIIAVRENNHISEEAKIALIKEDLARYGLFLAYTEYMADNGIEEGASIDFINMKDGMRAIIDQYKKLAIPNLPKQKNVILSALRFDTLDRLRFRGTDVMDKKNHQAYLEAANTLSLYWFDTTTNKIVTENAKNQLVEEGTDIGKMIKLDEYIGLFLKLEHQGFGTEQKAFQLLKKSTRDHIASIAVYGLNMVKDIIEEGTFENEGENGGKVLTFSDELTELRASFVESFLRRNLTALTDTYPTKRNGIVFETSGDMLLKGGEESGIKDYSGYESSPVLNGKGLFYDLKIVADKDMPPFIKANGQLYVRLLSTFNPESKVSSARTMAGKEIVREQKEGETSNNTHYFIKMPKSNAFVKESFLNNRLDPSYLSILPTSLSETEGEGLFVVRENLKNRMVLANGEKANASLAFLYDKNDLTLSNPRIISFNPTESYQVKTSGGRGLLYNQYAFKVVNDLSEASYRSRLSSPIKMNYNLFLEARELEEDDALNDNCEV